MKTLLKLFIESLEAAKKKEYLTRTIVTAMQKPAFKKITIELYKYENNCPELLLTVDKICRVTNDEEKQLAIQEVTGLLIQNVLEKYETI